MFIYIQIALMPIIQISEVLLRFEVECSVQVLGVHSMIPQAGEEIEGIYETIWKLDFNLIL